MNSIEFNLEKLEYLFTANIIREQIWLFKKVMLVSKELKARTVSLIYSNYTACDLSQKKSYWCAFMLERKLIHKCTEYILPQCVCKV